MNCRSIRPSEKALGKFKTRIKEVTTKNMTVDVEHHIKFEVNPIIRGWGNYFGIAAVKRVFETLDAWIRRRLRMVQFRSWRKKKKLHKELRRNNWKGPMPDIRMTKWRSSRSRPAHIAIPNERFRQYRLVFLLDIYKNLHPQRG
ncbi:group II intron maturase-specific domain-containing protein [Chryseomicrobium palamuruense]|uniref:Group II intron maturase-specific domain-containing protein n=1 Tax=Chryseomicrobium palamuruense TaxID=682973 RepID=A0ABV8UUV9_9BACL